MSSMRHLIAVALLVAGLALPACAQRGGVGGGSTGNSGGSVSRGGGFASRSAAPVGRSGGYSGFGGGFANHSAPSPNGSFVPMGRSGVAPAYRGGYAPAGRSGVASPYRRSYPTTGQSGAAPTYRGGSIPMQVTDSMGATQFNGYRGAGVAPGPSRSGQNGGGGQYGGADQSNWHHGHGGGGHDGEDGDRWPGLTPYEAGLGLGFPYVSGFWLNPYELDFLDSGPGDDSANAAPQQPQYDPSVANGAQNDAQSQPQPYDAQNDAQSQPQPVAQDPVPGPYAPSAYPAAQAYAPSPLSPDLEDESAVTLVFKDGRPSVQIHNYILTRTTLYVSGQHRSQIPVDQLDLAATEKVNHDAGVDFQLPDAVR